MMKAAPWPVTFLFALSLALNLWLAGVPDWRWLPAALAGWYVADLLSGVTHMYMDYRPCTPGIGLDRVFHYAGSRESADYLALRDRVMPRISPFERLVYDFKNHHPRPDALGRRPFLVQIGSTILFVYTHAQNQTVYDPAEGIGHPSFTRFGGGPGTDLLLLKLSLLIS